MLDVGSLQANFADCHRSIPAARSVGSRDSRVAATDHCAATGQAWSSAILSRRQDGSELGLLTLSKNPRGACHRSARDRGSVASRRFPALLALEVEASVGPPRGTGRDPAVDPGDERCQSIVGRTSHPRRNGQARHRPWPNQRCQVYGAKKRTAVARLEDLPAQSCGWHRRDGPVCRSDQSFRLLYGMLIIGHGRRQILWCGATSPDTGYQPVRHAGRSRHSRASYAATSGLQLPCAITSRASAIGAMKVEIRKLMWINRECHG